jgi:hypothetical protein
MYSGIDLHSNDSVVAVIDDADRAVAQKRLPNDIRKIVGFLARWKDGLAGVVVESAGVLPETQKGRRTPRSEQDRKTAYRIEFPSLVAAVIALQAPDQTVPRSRQR